MSDVTKEREALKIVYRGKKWVEKVNRMPDSQVIAVYKRFKAQKKL